MGNKGVRLVFVTVAALVAFAANSVLCRLALASHSIDPASFSLVRLASASAVLAAIVLLSRGKTSFRSGSWASAAMLATYAICFSFAYIGLTAGTGALLLFGAVQATMLIAAIRGGHQMSGRAWGGLALALGGLGYLVAPGVSAPPLGWAASMVVAGIAWGVYSLRGRGVSDPIGATAGNFARALPIAVVASLIAASQRHAEPTGIAWACVSGGLTSGLGYVVWYAAIPSLGAARAALLQLAVPIIATVGGVMVLGEQLTLRLLLASVVTLGGVYMASNAKSSTR